MDTTIIVRKGAVWYVTPSPGSAATKDTGDSGIIVPGDDEYPAGSEVMNNALDAITTMKKGDLVSQNPAKNLDIRVDSVTGLNVECWNDKGRGGTRHVGLTGNPISSGPKVLIMYILS